jgi:uncharacterized protein
MRIAVEAWAPEYGAELDAGAPAETTVENVTTACEKRPWAPVAPGEVGALAAGPVAFIDGTRRLDARVFVMNGGPAPIPGVAGSIGVGAVVCDGINGTGDETHSPDEWWRAKRAEVIDLRIDRFLAVGDGEVVSLTVGPGLEYQALPHPGTDLVQLVNAIHERMRAGEAALALEVAGDDERLVFIDGPLAVMRPGPQRIVGFIKAHHKRYLGAEEEAILGDLKCGERTPLFAFGEPRPRYSWYLRLCDLPSGQHGWYGLVRCEAPAALSLDTVVELADASAKVLPRFASAPHWDARAPQNLVPVAGLEKRMRHLLGDRVLVNRLIKSAAHRLSEGEPIG